MARMAFNLAESTIFLTALIAARIGTTLASKALEVADNVTAPFAQR